MFKSRMTRPIRLPAFVVSEDGAVTADMVVLMAGAVALGIAVGSTVSLGAADLSNKTSGELGAITVSSQGNGGSSGAGFSGTSAPGPGGQGNSGADTSDTSGDESTAQGGDDDGGSGISDTSDGGGQSDKGKSDKVKSDNDAAKSGKNKFWKWGNKGKGD